MYNIAFNFQFFIFHFTSQSEPSPGWCRCSRLMSLGRQTKNCEGRKEIFLMTHRVTSKPLGWVTDLAKAQIVMCYYKWVQSFCFSSYKYIPTNTIGGGKAPHVTSYAPESKEAFDCWRLTEGEGETDASGSSRYKQMRHSFILTCSLGARSRQRGFHTSAKISLISSADSNLVCLTTQAKPYELHEIHKKYITDYTSL